MVVVRFTSAYAFRPLRCEEKVVGFTTTVQYRKPMNNIIHFFPEKTTNLPQVLSQNVVLSKPHLRGIQTYNFSGESHLLHM